jgi:hypothetical protein
VCIEAHDIRSETTTGRTPSLMFQVAGILVKS